MTAQAPQQSRRGGTASRRAERASAPLIQERYITREIPLYELISEEGVELLHEQSMTILEEIGIEFRDEPALKLWREAGAVRLAGILCGETCMDSHTVLTSVVNCNSPMVWDATMLGSLACYARANQAVLVTPFIMAGAMAPASTAGAIAQLNAEVVAGIAYAQLVRPGAPMV